MNDNSETNEPTSEFDFSLFPPDTLFHDRRSGRDRRKSGRGPATGGKPGAESAPPAGGERRARKERRKRIDPTTFEKQYTEDELEFMGAMQRFKERTGKPFPTYAEVLKVAAELGYRKRLDATASEDLPLAAD